MKKVLLILCLIFTFNCNLQEDNLESGKVEEVKIISVEETYSNAVFVSNDTLGMVLFRKNAGFVESESLKDNGTD